MITSPRYRRSGGREKIAIVRATAIPEHTNPRAVNAAQRRGVRVRILSYEYSQTPRRSGISDTCVLYFGLTELRARLGAPFYSLSPQQLHQLADALQLLQLPN